MRFFVSSILLVFCMVITACSGDDTSEQIYPTDYVNKEHLIEPEELVELMQGSTDFVIIDIRKNAQYEKGHIAGAVQVWRPQITSDEFEYQGMVAEEAKIYKLLGDKGVFPSDKIILYDGKGGSDAARMWWVLEKYGHEKVCILNGGFKRWTELNNVVDTIVPTRDTVTYSHFTGTRDIKRSVDVNGVKSVLSDPNYVILDVRTKDEFTGKRQKKNAFKGGRIPGAIHWEWGCAVELDKDHVIKSPKDLLYELDSIGVTKDKTIICYCHSGVRSAHTTFVLSELLGFPNVMNYDGSWIEWSYFEDLPFETDNETPEILK